MRIKELKRKLKSKLRDSNYRISHPWELLKLRFINRLEVTNYEMTYRIFENGAEWKIIFEERGNQVNSKSFLKEEDACTYFETIFKEKT